VSVQPPATRGHRRPPAAQPGGRAAAPLPAGPARRGRPAAALDAQPRIDKLHREADQARLARPGPTPPPPRRRAAAPRGRAGPLPRTLTPSPPSNERLTCRCSCWSSPWWSWPSSPSASASTRATTRPLGPTGQLAGGFGFPERLLHREAAAGWAVAGGQPTVSGPVADQAACTARPPSSATRAVSCSRCAAPTRRPTWRSRDAASTDPWARAGTAAARQLRVGTVPSPGRPRPPNHDPGDGFLTCNLLAPLTNAALRKHDADLASREDVLRAHLMVGARATQDHQTGRPHRQPMAAGTVWSPACSPPTWWSPS
jgi:hypothetical protein